MKERPNIVLIMTDQQRFDTIGKLGYPYADTPNIDRLVSEGVSFSNCHVTAASCAPARASLFTGLYPHSCGVLRNKDRWDHSWVESLAQAGYHCVNVGKMHTFPFDAPVGFHERYVVENKDRFLEGRYFFDEWDKAYFARKLEKPGRINYRTWSDYRDRMGVFEWQHDRELHPDVFVGNLAISWLEHYPRTEPLFLQIGFPGPHPPYDAPAEYSQSYLEKDLPILGVTPGDVEGQPPPLQALRHHNCEVDHDAVVHDLVPSPDKLKKLRAAYLGNVTLIDEQVGRIVAALESSGYLENTVVVFVSDHGDCLGDHGHIQKWTMYDAITRVPTVVWAPDRFAGGRSIDSLWQLFDVGPTILELAGMARPDYMQAHSMMKALRGENDSGREYVFAEQPSDSNLKGVKMMTMVRSSDWKLVHFAGEEYGQLFDLQNDPNEIDNLWDDASHVNVKRELLHVLHEWYVDTALSASMWSSTWR